MQFEIELSEHEEYKRICTGLGIASCDFNGWQIYSALLDENHVPYLTKLDTVWARDLRKKTGRSDRPIMVVVQSLLI